MKPDSFIVSVILSLGIAGCSTAGGGTAATPAAGPVAQGDMTEFCQNAAASKFGAAPVNITTNPPIPRDSGLLVQGSVSTDTYPYNFDCRFDATGKFVDIIRQ
jgi:hypothetical protein